MTHRFRIRSDFNEAASSYNQHAILQHDVSKHLVRLASTYFKPEDIILDAGCGTGFFSQHTSSYNIIPLDLAYNMCAIAQNNIGAVNADIHALPVRPESMDGIFSSLTLQWSDPFTTALQQLYESLKPNGYLCFSTIGPHSLEELASSFHSIGHPPPLYPFMDQSDIADCLRKASFRISEQQTQDISYPFTSAKNIMQNLKAIGAQYKKPRPLLTRQKLAALEHVYPHENQIYLASWEIYYFIVQKI